MECRIKKPIYHLLSVLEEGVNWFVNVNLKKKKW